MPNFRYLVLLLLLAPASNTVRSEDVDYLRDIKPVLKAKCYSCHGALKQEAGLRVDTVEFMREGGDSGRALSREEGLDSLIHDRISSSDNDERMPPEGEPLSPEQLKRFQQWLANGAKAPEDELAQADPATHWAFQPLQATAKSSTAIGTIDNMIDTRLTEKGLKRADRADPITLVRRLFLDLHGLPPTPEDLDYWVPRLSGPAELAAEATKRLVDELLASPRYGERWAQHWLDIVRYADTHGYEVNTPRPNAWPYRDYVIQSFNSDTPYDQFVREQLYGDGLEAPAATGFLVAAAALLPGQIGKDDASKRLARQDELDEIIVGTTATFLGLTVGCARCHDHKFDPIPQEDYYAMQAFFAGVKYGDREVRDEAFAERVAQADALIPKINALHQQLSAFQPKAHTGRTIIIDDEDLARVSILAKKNGYGSNPAGTKRGYKDDPGDASRVGNLSQGRYTWWDNQPGQDVLTWNPQSAGKFRVWVSWGVHGSGVHTRDARYVLDLDGNLSTQDDQQEIATADQYYFVGVSEGETEKKPMWSGLFDTGIHQLTQDSKIVLRCGNTNTGITADVVVLQECKERNTTPEQPLPLLRKPVDFAQNVERFQPVDAKFVRFTSSETVDNDKHKPCIDELEVFSTDSKRGNVALASHGTRPSSSGNYSTTGKHQLKHINDGRYGNDFSWISNEHGKGWVQLEFTQIENIERIQWGRDKNGKFKDRLAIDYRIETSIDGESWTLVASSLDRVPQGTPHNDSLALLRNHAGENENSTSIAELAAQIKSLEEKDKQLRKPKEIFAGRFKKPETTYLLNRGDPEQRLNPVAPHVLSTLGNLSLPTETADRDRRRVLADWIASGDNPLTARVMVNRIWQYHFGIGLVETSSDFGLNGSRPSHPELLDWLAKEFIASGWSVKHLHRIILASGTYQQASALSQEQAIQGARVDGDNRLLWRFPSRRLEAEAIRDCVLQVSGKLNLAMGGAGFDFFQSRGGLSGFPPVEDFGAKQLKRMIYAHKIRMEQVPVFGAFDCPDAGLPAPRRSQSTTAIQALSLFNSKFILDQSQAFASRISLDTLPLAEASNAPTVTLPLAGGSDDSPGRALPSSEFRSPRLNPIQLAFLHALGRLPTSAELTSASEVVDTHGLPTLCRVLFNSNEFLYLP